MAPNEVPQQGLRPARSFDRVRSRQGGQEVEFDVGPREVTRRGRSWGRPGNALRGRPAVDEAQFQDGRRRRSHPMTMARPGGQRRVPGVGSFNRRFSRRGAGPARVWERVGLPLGCFRPRYIGAPPDVG